ncbi:MAG: glycoside hydrolase family 44 protein [Clostridia bacterium]
MLRWRAYTGLTNLSGGFTRRRKFPRQKALVPEMASRAALALTGAHAATLAFFAVVIAAVSIAGVAAVGALRECAAAAPGIASPDEQAIRQVVADLYRAMTLKDVDLMLSLFVPPDPGEDGNVAAVKAQILSELGPVVAITGDFTRANLVLGDGVAVVRLPETMTVKDPRSGAQKDVRVNAELRLALTRSGWKIASKRALPPDAAESQGPELGERAPDAARAGAEPAGFSPKTSTTRVAVETVSGDHHGDHQATEGLSGDPTTPPAAGLVDATITVDTQRPGLVISPYVYGSAWGQWVGKLPPDDEVADLRVRLIRFGGNNISRYNWRIDTYNDWWTKRNVVQTPGLLEFVTWARSHGAEPLIQVNAFGFAPAETSSTEMSRIMDADAAADLVRFLNVQHGLGVRFFEIDNEPFIWHETHRDYQKRPIGYDEYLERFVEFSRAMKEVDPSIVVMGPSNCNPTYYLRSALAGDRVVKGDWIPYMLRYCAEYEARHGLRVLDAVSFHRYPIYRSFSAKEVRAKPQDILDATREWWDPLYNPTILDPTSEPAVRAILPLFRRWIDQNYPGTALALTEYNLDFDSSIEYPPDVRALWLAEVLGQLARHEVRYSVYWNLQEEGHHGLVRMDGRPTGTYHVFRLYSHNLTGRMLPVKGELARVHAFAALNQDGTVAVLVNNLDLEAGCDVELVLSEVSGSRRVHLALEPGSVTAITVAPGDAKAIVEIFDP